MKKESKKIIDELKTHPKVQQMGLYYQHGSVTTLEHCERVTKTSVKINDMLKLDADESSLVRGAMLHDFYLYDWHDAGGDHKWHGFHHADKALENADTYFSINDVERTIIYCHMWPLNLTRIPRTKEAWIVCMADKWCSLDETLFRRKKHVG